MPNRYIHAGVYQDRDGATKDIFYGFCKQRNGKTVIDFKDAGGKHFEYRNAGSSKIDMINFEPHLKEAWEEYLADDDSWLPDQKHRGMAARRSALEAFFDDPNFVDPFWTAGRTVAARGRPVNTAHSAANPIPGGAAAPGFDWQDPGDSDDDEDDDDSAESLPPDGDDNDDDDDEDDEGMFVDENVAEPQEPDHLEADQDAAIQIEKESDHDDDDEDDLPPVERLVQSRRKGKGRAEADEVPAHPFANFFHRANDLVSPSVSPPPSGPIDLTGDEESPPSRGRSSRRVIDLSESNQNIIIDNSMVDLTGDDVTNPDIPMPSIEEDSDVKSESRKSTPYRMRSKGGVLRTRSQSPVRVDHHSPDRVQTPGSWPGRGKSRKRERSSSILSIRIRIKSPSIPTPFSSALRKLRAKRETEAKVNTKSAVDLESTSEKFSKDQKTVGNGASSSSSSSKKPSRPIIIVDQDEVIIIED